MKRETYGDRSKFSSNTKAKVGKVNWQIGSGKSVGQQNSLQIESETSTWFVVVHTAFFTELTKCEFETEKSEL